jgi:2-polyprenyl-3-methyl-5-hydroxy-6-metoxy-1,4-benzoquinol methylase
MVTLNSDRDWECFATIDPYYAVATHEKFRRENLNEDVLREFFEVGQRHVEQIFKIIHTYFEPGFRPSRALDFGCGVARLVMPLARLCTSVVGVDVSESMLLEAKRNCEKRHISNVEFIKGDDELARVSGLFDLINSHVVFQHIPTRRGERLLRRLIALLEDRGIGVLHFAYATESPRIKKAVQALRKSVPGVHGVLNLLQGKVFDYPQMQGNRYHLNTIFRILQANGCADLYVRFTDYPGNYGVILFFRKGVGRQSSE